MARSDRQQDRGIATREKLVEAASKRFRSDGFAGTTIPSVMREIGLSHGGFYNHFESKEDLFAAAVMHAASESGDWLEAQVEGLEGAAWVDHWVDRYVSERHCANLKTGCPIPLLLPEVMREGRAACSAFESALDRRLERVGPHLDLPPDIAKRRFRSAYAHMAGAVMLSRVLGVENTTQLRHDVARSVKAMLLADEDTDS